MAHWIRWYGPNSGRGSVEDIVSHKPGVKSELAFQAGLIYARAKTNLELAPKHRTGQSTISLKGPSSGRRLDYEVSLSANDASNKIASLSIEKELGVLGNAMGRAIRRGRGIV